MHENFLLSDHSPFLFTCGSVNSSFKSSPLTCSYSFDSTHQMPSFIDSWSTFTFVDFPSPATITSFYSHLNINIPIIFRQKRGKRLISPLCYSSHTIHYSNVKDTAEKKYVPNSTAGNFGNFQQAKKDLSNSMELDKVCFLTGALTQSSNDVFSMLNSFKTQNFPSSMKYKCHLFNKDFDIANGLNEFFSSMLTAVRILHLFLFVSVTNSSRIFSKL